MIVAGRRCGRCNLRPHSAWGLAGPALLLSPQGLANPGTGLADHRVLASASRTRCWQVDRQLGPRSRDDRCHDVGDWTGGWNRRPERRRAGRGLGDGRIAGRADGLGALRPRRLISPGRSTRPGGASNRHRSRGRGRRKERGPGAGSLDRQAIRGGVGYGAGRFRQPGNQPPPRSRRGGAEPTARANAGPPLMVGPHPGIPETSRLLPRLFGHASLSGPPDRALFGANGDSAPAGAKGTPPGTPGPGPAGAGGEGRRCRFAAQPETVAHNLSYNTL